MKKVFVIKLESPAMDDSYYVYSSLEACRKAFVNIAIGIGLSYDSNIQGSAEDPWIKNNSRNTEAMLSLASRDFYEHEGKRLSIAEYAN